jgi:hypothetical protein
MLNWVEAYRAHTHSKISVLNWWTKVKGFWPWHLPNLKGWLKSKALTHIPWNYEIKQPKPEILGWVILLALDFQRTLPLKLHPVIVGLLGWAKYFQPTMWKPKNLPWKRKVLAVSFAPIHNVHLQKATIIFKGHSSAHIARFGITSKLAPLNLWTAIT